MAHQDRDHELPPIAVDETPKPCARRFAPGRWCTRDDKHAGECDGPPAREPAPSPREKGRVA